MKRLERWGSVVFVTIIASLLFHIIGMSYNDWILYKYKAPDNYTGLTTWRTSLLQRCYTVSAASAFDLLNTTNSNSLSTDALTTDICIPNKFLIALKNEYAQSCFDMAKDLQDTVCALGNYDHNLCKCDYFASTKAVLAMTILASISLGIMIFISHATTFITEHRILKWLIPLGLGLMVFSFVDIMVALIIASARKNQDLIELRYSWTLAETANNPANGPLSFGEIKSRATNETIIKIGWCFGMEIMALYFCAISIILYLLSFYVKNRPESR